MQRDGDNYLKNGLLPVNEIFATLQGEAAWTGTPSTFVRLQGCDVGCPWCDTKYTWAVEPHQELSSLLAVAAKQTDAPTFAWASSEHLARCIMGYDPQHVVITGGEPCEYDLRELTTLLLNNNHTVQIETSGTRPIRCDSQTFVTVSPKINMPGGYEVLDEALDRANEIKMPVGKPADIERVAVIERRIWRRLPAPTIWLQPLSTSEKATELCIREATKRGWRVSIQTHKFIGVR